MDISGTAALVTGASRGLGEALALELGRQGAKVVLVSRSRSALEPIVRRIREQGGQAHALEADVGEKGDVYPLAGAASALVGPIDLLIHNASELGPTLMHEHVVTRSTGVQENWPRRIQPASSCHRHHFGWGQSLGTPAMN